MDSWQIHLEPALVSGDVKSKTSIRHRNHEALAARRSVRVIFEAELIEEEPTRKRAASNGRRPKQLQVIALQTIPYDHDNISDT